jgi:hypothetical protein
VRPDRLPDRLKADLEMELSYATAASIRHVEVEGLRIILDLATESYRILDDTASALWPVLIGERDARAACAALAADYDITEEDLVSELEEFGKSCVRDGLLLPSCAPSRLAPSQPAKNSPPAPRTGRNRPGLLGALICLLSTRRSLKRRGFCATYESYARIVTRPAQAPLELSLSAFRRAENLFVAGRAPGDCLLRSLSLYRFLRSFGCDANHVIGVRRFAFSAHAWVEHDGRALLDERAPEFTPIARIGPPLQPAA